MKKATVIIIALVALVCMGACSYAFLSTGNGLWAIFAVICASVLTCASADLIEICADESFVERMFGK